MTENTIIQVKTGERSYRLECSPDSPLGELYDALNQMRDFVITKINNESDRCEQNVPKE